MDALRKLCFAGLFQHRRIKAVSDHVKEMAAEFIEALAEYRNVREFVLAENIQRLIGDQRTCQQQAIPRQLRKPMQSFAGLRLMILDLVTFVADDHVRLPRDQFFFQSPD